MKTKIKPRVFFDIEIGDEKGFYFILKILIVVV